MKKYIKDFEWELLQEKVKIDKIIPSESVPKNIVKLEAYRDSAYNIKAKLIFIEEERIEGRYLLNSNVGKSINRFTVKGSRLYGIQEVELIDCYITHVKISTNKKNPSTVDGELTLSVDEIKTKNKLNAEPSLLVDWYVNGPKLNFPRFTKRETILNFKKIKTSIDGLDIEFNYDSSMYDIKCDFAYINTEDVKFLIIDVDEDFGPTWSKNIGIEYRSELGSIPDFEKRQAISEIVSFVFGKHLIHVGYTLYGNKGEILEQSSVSHYVDNLLSLCQNAGSEPIKIITKFTPPSFDSCQNPDIEPMRISYNGLGLEEILNKLVPEYLKLRDELNLKESLYRYWISMNAPIGTNLPILSSALETLMKGWFKSNKSKSQAAYIPKEEFNKLLGEDFVNIEEKLDEFIKNKIEGLESEEREQREQQEYFELKKPVMDKIRNSYQMSVNRSYKTFLKEIGLKIGKIEGNAIKARNPMAHGGQGFEGFEEMIMNTDAYQTLFNRVILKLLNFEGSYIDRSTYDYPEKRIDEPLGGKD